MEMYGEKTINRGMTIKDECGKTMTAMKVFSTGIKYLKNHLLEKCENMLSSGIYETEVRWVITVPGIWSDFAKQFMREAAEQAGIASDQLLISLEPEAASLYCKYTPMTIDSDRDFSALKTDSTYLVLDAGGGRVDITVHKVTRHGSIKEKHKANGGDWGGTKVDDAFGNFLSGIVGIRAYDKFCDEDKLDVLDLFREFEMKKRTISPNGDESVYVRIPLKLNECCKLENGKDISERVRSNCKFGDNVIVVLDKMRLKSSIGRDMIKRQPTK